MAARGKARGTIEIVCDVGALVDPDAATVDALARLQLLSRRLGLRLVLRHASPRLQELLTFLGLEDAVPLADDLPLEPGRQAE